MDLDKQDLLRRLKHAEFEIANCARKLAGRLTLTEAEAIERELRAYQVEREELRKELKLR